MGDKAQEEQELEQAWEEQLKAWRNARRYAIENITRIEERLAELRQRKK